MLRYKIVLIICFSLCFIVNACDDNTLNYDQKDITSEQLSADGNEGAFRLPGMMESLLSTNETWRFEMQQNLNADTYAGYMALPAAFFGNSNNVTYSMVVQWNDQIWVPPSNGIFDRWVAMEKSGYKEKYPDLFAIATIIKAIAGLRVTDTIGPISYTQYGTAAEVPFDSVEEIYNTIFEELKESVTTLKDFQEENPGAWKIRFSNFDISEYGGDYQKWVRLANTIRLRMAMRISDVKPNIARKEAEAAVQDGVLTVDDGNFAIKSSNGRHPLDVITNDWDETRLAAPVETILKGYNDPRLSEYALPAEHPDVEGEIKGVRVGTSFPFTNAYYPFSKVNFGGNPPHKIVSAAESYFLRAEGVLKGWDMGGGTAKQYYENGIRASFEINNVSGVEEYLNDGTSTPITYTDPVNPANNMPPLSDITIKWVENASIDEKMERIITQKWIALYPEGVEAWAEFRRTGYPNLYPVVVNKSNGQIADGEFIKRMSYPQVMKNSSTTYLPQAVDEYFNGDDNIGTRLWWDVD